MKLYLDPGAQGNGMKEKDGVLDIAHRIRSSLLNDYENVEVKMIRTSDISKSLDQRTNEANSWGADYYLSIHCNAHNGSAQGYEDFIQILTRRSFWISIHATMQKLDVILQEVKS